MGMHIWMGMPLQSFPTLLQGQQIYGELLRQLKQGKVIGSQVECRKLI
jgi:hypothetical protein